MNVATWAVTLFLACMVAGTAPVAALLAWAYCWLYVGLVLREIWSEW